MQTLQKIMAEHFSVAEQVRETMLPAVEEVVHLITQAFDGGGCLYVFGNGGSAADAQHFAAELVGRFQVERNPLPAVALSTDTSALTCIGNDYSFADVFARQVRGLVGPKDVVVGITTSGNSENVVRALMAARHLGATTIALMGATGGRAAEAAQQVLAVPSTTTARVQEMHILLIHMICAKIDECACQSDSDSRR